MPVIVIVSGVCGVMVDAYDEVTRGVALPLHSDSRRFFENSRVNALPRVATISSSRGALVSESVVLSLLVFTVLRTAVISEFVYP